MDGQPVSTIQEARREDGKPGKRRKIPSSQRARIPGSRPRSELVVTPRANGGVSIAQGPVYVLVGPKEIEPLMEAIRTTE